MSTKERIKKIEIECRELLAIAEKRLQGKWCHTVAGQYACDIGAFYVSTINAPFIAACAGPAEAGWRATIGRIEFVKKLRSYDAELNPMIHSLADEEEAAIVADWEEGNH